MLWQVRLIWAVLFATSALVPAFAAHAADAPAAAPAHVAKAAVWGKLVSADGKTSYPLSGAEVVVGSDAAAGVVVHDPTVAPQHCKLIYRDGLVELEDLGSKFGTLVAGTQVKKGKNFKILQPVDLGMGAATLRFEFGERPAILPATQKAPPAKKKPAKSSKKTK